MFLQITPNLLLFRQIIFNWLQVPSKWDFESPARQVQLDIFTISSRYDAARDDYVELHLSGEQRLFDWNWLLSCGERCVRDRNQLENYSK